MGYRGCRPWALLAMGVQEVWGTGVWGTWVIGHRGYGVEGLWATSAMGHMGNGVHGQWGTGVWAMGPMGDLHPKYQTDVKMSKRCQVVKKMSNVK